MSDILILRTPKETSVYRIDTQDPSNWHLVANRAIAQGEFLTTPGCSSLVNAQGVDVVEVVLEETQESKQISIALSGVPGDVSCVHNTLEIPWCFMNHSCAPNTFDQWPREGIPELKSAETVAVRDIALGEELTSDYVTEYFDYIPAFACWCGAETCRGIIRGFNGLSDIEKERHLPETSPFIQARHAQMAKKDTKT